MWIRWIRIRIRNTVSSTYWYLLYVPDRTFLCTVPPGADSLHVQVQVRTSTRVVPGNSRGPGGKGGILILTKNVISLICIIFCDYRTGRGGIFYLLKCLPGVPTTVFTGSYIRYY
jgi:hypothetical protein